MITCTYESGNQASLRHVTVDTIVTYKRKILLGKRGTYHGKPLLEFGKWALLGGFMDRDEDLFQAAKREVYEESGLKLEGLTLFRIIHTPDRPKEDRQNVNFSFFAESVDYQVKLSEETKELKWFDSDDMPPENEWAFDHYQTFMLYRQHRDNPMRLPVIG